MTTDSDYSQFAQWEHVPARVRTLLPAAFALHVMHNKVASDAGILGIASVSWEPENQRINVHTPERLSDRLKTAYANTLHAAGPVVFTQADPDISTAVIVKQAIIAPSVGKAWQGANKVLGGPTPLSNAIVSGLVLGGLGYGTGTLLEHLIPDTYLERGRFRNPMAIAGLLGGVGVGALNAGETARQLNQGYLKSWVTSNNTPLPKQAFDSFTNLRAPTIQVDAFNRAVWADARTGYNQTGIIAGHTAPSIAAATTGMMSGIAAQARSPIISPSTVINGLASAGVGLATANIAGRTLGALAGLTPAAQTKIQDAGLWAGMLHAVVPPIFGAR
jgi:hypothetical protein